MSTDLDLDVNPHSFNWLISNFVRGTDGVRDAVAVSSDGLLIANPSRAGSDPVVGQARRVLTKRDRAARYRGIGAAFDE